MSRNSSGTYTLPNSAVVTGTAITATDENATRNDIATVLTASLDRSGNGHFLADGSVSTPIVSWDSDPDNGLYRIGTNDTAYAAGGVKVLEFTATLVTVAVDALIGGAKLILDTANNILKATASNTSLTVQGNRSAADSGSDVVVNSTATRTAGNIADFQNNTSSKLKVDFAGQIKWPSGPSSTSTTPAPSAVTAITPNTNWTASADLAYWKDPVGIVHLKGNITNATGGGSGNIVTTSPLPAGFRPAAARNFNVWDTTAIKIFQVTSSGTIVMNGSTLNNGVVVYLDGVSYLAEA